MNIQELYKYEIASSFWGSIFGINTPIVSRFILTRLLKKTERKFSNYNQILLVQKLVESGKTEKEAIYQSFNNKMH